MARKNRNNGTETITEAPRTVEDVNRDQAAEMEAANGPIDEKEAPAESPSGDEPLTAAARVFGSVDEANAAGSPNPKYRLFVDENEDELVLGYTWARDYFQAAHRFKTAEGHSIKVAEEKPRNLSTTSIKSAVSKLSAEERAELLRQIAEMS